SPLADAPPRGMTTDLIRPATPSIGQADATDGGPTADSPGPMDPSAGGASGSSIEGAAALMDALAATTPIAGPPAGRPRPASDAPAPLRGPRHRPVEAADPGDAPRRSRPSPRLRI